MSPSTPGPDAPGWDALDRFVGARYVGQTPHQFTSRTPYELDTPSPLPAVTVWSSAKAPRSWHYVTYGLSELFEKTSNDPNISGFGYELTMRLPRRETDEHPPVWALRLLQSLGHHVLSTRADLDSGHVLALGSSLVPPESDGPESCALTGLALLPDPTLGKLSGPFGSVLFLQLYGLTDDELEAVRELELGDLAACLAELSPSMLTDPERASWLSHPEKSKILRRYKVGLSL